ncbi:MAG: AAA family ATPase [Desulfobacteraceae bacterium]|nr:AAA family ATPase [Desulfobacteraceae bacterium]
MIESIRIQDEASYVGIPQDLKNLSLHNYIFGSNGTGKTTISRIIANESDFPHCAVSWRGGSKLATVVYNRDFVAKNFDQPSELKGIFTLGEEDKSAITKIETAKSQLDVLVGEIRTFTNTLEGDDGEGGKVEESGRLESDFTEMCWRLKKKHDAKLQGAFAGVRKRKEAFRDKIFAEATTNSADLKPLATLEEKAKAVFGEEPEKVTPFTMPRFNDLLKLESHPILAKNVVGKPDVDIAAMIHKLGNSDWIKQGRTYYEDNEGFCPFCQQTTEDSLEVSLNEYFDEAFETDTKAIEQLYIDYKSSGESLMQAFETLLVTPSEFLDAEKLISQKELLQSKIRNNLQRIEKKRVKSSQIVELDSLSNMQSAAKGMIEAANGVIKEHNDMVDNLGRESRKLTAQVWKYLLESEIKADLAAYEKKKKGLLKAINSLNEQIAAKKKDKKDKEVEIRELEKVTTSIQPTIDGINALIDSFGFTNFALAMSDRKRFYKIVRPDGSDAKETLSEGEKNFITFLYFYYLLNGSETESGITTDRIVVFDDPVSSLDSDILFIVSTLIKGLMEEVERNSGHVKQVFVLTHNVYFHKEVSYNKKRRNGGKRKEETFWIVRKSNNGSILQPYNMNPIKTSYELLWMEVRNRDRSNLAIQNTLRRIIENYFKILGNVSPDDICACFEGREKLICKSLFSWVNAGSHFAHDDIYISVDEASVDKYLAIFEKIFEKTGHPGHYKMMMGEDLSETGPQTDQA